MVGADWTVKGHFAGHSSVGFVVARRGKLRWDLKIANGLPHGDFSCAGGVGDRLSAKGAVIKGVVHGPVHATDGRVSYTLTYATGLLREVVDDKDHSRLLGSKQSLDELNLDGEFREFVEMAVGSVREFVVPYI